MVTKTTARGGELVSWAGAPHHVDEGMLLTHKKHQYIEHTPAIWKHWCGYWHAGMLTERAQCHMLLRKVANDGRRT